MSDITSQGAVHRDEILSALFAQMVMQQANMAMMLLGRVPHPESGETVQDLDGARLFIDQLEMIEAKTKGNLNKDEEALLRQSLTSLRMAFVEAVNSSGPETQPQATPKIEPAAGAATRQSEPSPQPAPAAEEESKKKFSKKY